VLLHHPHTFHTKINLGSTQLAHVLIKVWCKLFRPYPHFRDYPFFCLMYCKNWLNQSQTFSPHFPSDSSISPSDLVALSVCCNRAECMLWSSLAGGVGLLPLVSFPQALPPLRGWSIFQGGNLDGILTCFSLLDSSDSVYLNHDHICLLLLQQWFALWFLGWNIRSPSTSLSLLSLVEGLPTFENQEIHAVVVPLVAKRVPGRGSRFAHTQGKPGGNKPCDLHNEHLNHTIKAAIGGQGSNLKPKAILQIGKVWSTWCCVSTIWQCLLWSNRHGASRNEDLTKMVVNCRLQMSSKKWQAANRAHSLT